MSVVDEPGARPTLGTRLSAGLRRGLVLGASAALGVGLLAGVASDGDGGTPGATDLRPAAGATASAPLRTFSLNVRFSMGPARARSDMNKALTTLGASVGGFQEISQRVDRDTLHALLREHGWGWYQPRSVPIPVVFDRDRFRLASGRTVKVHGPQEGVTPTRWITIVKLREVSTGRIFGVINTHTISGASRDAQASNMARIPRLRRHLAMLRDEIVALAEETEQVVAMGDLNVNYLADRRRQVAGLPTDVLGPVVNFDMPLVGSRGLKSLLDYVMSVKGGSLERTAGQIVRGFNSDHQAVVVTYDVAGAAPPPPPPPPPAPVFETGPVTNAPQPGTASRAVLDQWSRAIGSARKGTPVRVATPRISDARVVNDLLAAAERGARVRVLLNGGARTNQERRLASALGGLGSGGSWVGTARRDSRASFLLVEDAGGTSNLTLSTSAPATAQATRALADAYLTADRATYDAFVSTFSALRTGSSVPSARVASAQGSELSVQFGPVAAGTPDPVARALRPVRCSGATAARTADGKSQIRLAVRTWQGRRGIALAKQLGRKARWGCAVRVLAGKHVGNRVHRVLRRHGVRVRRTEVSQTLLLTEGRYWGNGAAERTWVGTDALNTRGLAKVSQTIRSTSPDTLTAYRQQFVRTWRAAR